VLYGHGKLKNYPFSPIYLTGNIPLQFIVFLCLVIIAQFAVVYVLITQEKAVASNLANALEATWEEELNSPGAMSLYLCTFLTLLTLECYNVKNNMLSINLDRSY